MRDLKAELDTLSRKINLSLATKDKPEEVVAEQSVELKVVDTESESRYVKNVRSGKIMSLKEIIDDNKDRVIIGSIPRSGDAMVTQEVGEIERRPVKGVKM